MSYITWKTSVPFRKQEPLFKALVDANGNFEEYYDDNENSGLSLQRLEIPLKKRNRMKASERKKISSGIYWLMNKLEIVDGLKTYQSLKLINS